MKYFCLIFIADITQYLIIWQKEGGSGRKERDFIYTWTICLSLDGFVGKFVNSLNYNNTVTVSIGFLHEKFI